MKYAKAIGLIYAILVALAILIPTNIVDALDQIEEKPWSGTLKNGTKINEQALNKILIKHKEWLDTKDKDPKDRKGEKANLHEANLQGANLERAVLQEAFLEGVNLQDADLYEAELQGANLAGADLQGAFLFQAKLQRANLQEANLQKASLGGACLQGAIITHADLKDCYLHLVEHVPFKYYEPKPGSTPYFPSLVEATWLQDLTYDNKAHGLVDLREGFKKLGYREQERQITYAIQHTQTNKILAKWTDDTSVVNLLKFIFNFVFFEWTCEWGMSPGRPIVILFCLILPFSLVYMFALIKTDTKSRIGIKEGDGIWKVWIEDRANKDRGSDQNELLSGLKWYQIVGYGSYFSLLSAFHLGYRDITVGGWITKLQPREFRLAASGWVRPVAGIQSLISLYLLALFVLTYFGRPFESY